MSRNQFEENTDDSIPEEMREHLDFPYQVLPPIRDDLTYRLIPSKDGRVGLVIVRKDIVERLKNPVVREAMSRAADPADRYRVNE